MITFFFVSSFIYLCFVLFFILGIFRLSKKTNNEIQDISVIIAARNEEKYLPELLKILQNQNYPTINYEVIVVDDRSEDATFQIVKNFQKSFPNLKLVIIEKESDELFGKKNAVNFAIKQAEFEILAFTDADCLPPHNWLKSINSYFTDEVDFLAGFSPLIQKNRFISMLKNLERASIFAITAGSFGWNWGVTCTGRNMIYRKSIFEKVNGFAGIGHLKSGDDDLLLQKMSKHIRKMNFMFSQDSIVKSFDKDHPTEHIDLETRRASKWKYYPISIKILTLFFLFYYLVFALSFVMLILGNISILQFVELFLIKIVPEFLLLITFLAKIKQIKIMQTFPLAEILYIPYFIYFALKGTLGTYKWKE